MFQNFEKPDVWKELKNKFVKSFALKKKEFGK